MGPLRKKKTRTWCMTHSKRMCSPEWKGSRSPRALTPHALLPWPLVSRPPNVAPRPSSLALGPSFLASPLPMNRGGTGSSSPSPRRVSSNVGSVDVTTGNPPGWVMTNLWPLPHAIGRAGGTLLATTRFHLGSPN